MGSESRSPDGDGAAGLGIALAARVAPRQRTGRRRLLGHDVGSIARRSTHFGSLLGLSTINRHDSIAEGTGEWASASLTVRPPIEYWPWTAGVDDEPESAPRRANAS